MIEIAANSSSGILLKHVSLQESGVPMGAAATHPVVLVLIVGLLAVIVGIIQAWLVYYTAVKTAMLSGAPSVPPGTMASAIGAGAKGARNTLLAGLAVAGACQLLPITHPA